ncbi:hypothetical protein, partial [Bacillus toyonensis]|uniref:hypothetical protein n=1 Tax=Bacillus toyonensis TaxID=155322 RepID=UPI001483B556
EESRRTKEGRRTKESRRTEKARRAEESRGTEKIETDKSGVTALVKQLENKNVVQEITSE